VNQETVSIIVEGLVVLVCISMGVRMGGMAIGLWGGVGVLILSVVFGLSPGSVPTSAILIILAVVTAAGAMQVAGGVDWLVTVADKVIRTRPKQVTTISPLTTYTFTIGAGTGNIYYSLLPVIEEVSFENDVRPERPLGISPVASQMGITSSPVSSAMAAMVGLMAPLGFEIQNILSIVIPASLVGIIIAALVQTRVGKDLEDDPEYLRRLEAGEVEAPHAAVIDAEDLPKAAKTSALIFLAGVVSIVLFGLFEGLRPPKMGFRDLEPMSMTLLIQIIMFTIAVIILIVTKADVTKIGKSQIFGSGMVAIVALFGVAWMANTFIEAHEEAIVNALDGLAETSVLFIALALFLMAALTTSQTSTTLAIIPIGIALGIPPQYLVAMWPAVIGIYLLPANGGQIATVQFDRTGTTRIGKYVFNHSFLLPMLIAGTVAVAVGMVLATLFYGPN
jgi:anaerobic C4-dicarboxylate transporter DcuA/anaerobic C4-dicarboxylate transporter DcuB